MHVEMPKSPTVPGVVVTNDLTTRTYPPGAKPLVVKKPQDSEFITVQKLSPRSILVFTGEYHVISNTSTVNNCIISYNIISYAVSIDLLILGVINWFIFGYYI